MSNIRPFSASASRSGRDLLLRITKLNGRISITPDEVLRAIFGILPSLLSEALEFERSAPEGGALTEGSTLILRGIFGGASRRKESKKADARAKTERNFKHAPPAKVAYEDDFILVADKPKGVLVHPDSATAEATLADMVAAHFAANYGSAKHGPAHSSPKSDAAAPASKHGTEKADANGDAAPEPLHIHRIDTGTSGLVIFAKDAMTQKILDRMLFEGRIERVYEAVAEGIFKAERGTIDLPIGRDRHDAKRYRVDAGGQSAVTHYRVVSADRSKGVSKLLLTLETGRTHQIRVHLSHMRHPIAGDALYGSRTVMKKGHFMLHSKEVRFVHPYTGERVEIVSEAPASD